MIELERKAFDLWRTEAPDKFKRTVVTQLYEMIAEKPNSTNRILAGRLKSLNANITEQIFNDALASLKAFGVVATVPSPHCDGTFHANIIRRKQNLWSAYCHEVVNAVI